MVKREILNAEGSLMMVRVELQKGFHGEMDQHPEEQLSYIEKGKVEFEVEGEIRLLEQGAHQYIASNVPHRVNVIEECVIIDIFTPIRSDLLNK
jgi:quercetin dioxygenase-like cupin family protein